MGGYTANISDISNITDKQKHTLVSKVKPKRRAVDDPNNIYISLPSVPDIERQIYTLPCAQHELSQAFVASSE